MTRLYDVTVGKFDQFKRLLAQGNLDGELLEALLQRQDLVDGMISWVRLQLVPPAVGGRVFKDSNVVGWYGKPQEQLANLRRWNRQRRWGFTRVDFPPAPKKFLPSHRHEVLVLVAYLPDTEEDGMLVPGYVRTFNEYSYIIQTEQPDSGFWESPRNADDIRLLPGTEERHQPGIRWMVVDLGANPNSKPVDIRDASSAHVEVLAAFAQMPGYVLEQPWFNQKATDLWLAGYQVTDRTSGGSAWGKVPKMFCHQFEHDRNPKYSLHDGNAGHPSLNTFAPTTRQFAA